MNYLQNKKNLGGPVAGIIIGVLSFLLIQLIGAILIALLITRETIGEGSIPILSYILRGLGTICAVVVAWLMSDQNKVINSGIAAGACFGIQAIAGMLLWQIDLHAILLGFVIAVAVYAACVFVLSHNSGRGEWRKLKKRYS